MPAAKKEIPLNSLQRELRLRLLELYKMANAGHIGCSLSCIDILIATLLHTKKENDELILSKGHAAAALYVCLNHMGEISDAELKTFYKDGTTLPAHAAPGTFRNIPFATGSLGHGLPIACGIAKANTLDRNEDFVYVLMSDGETNEGTTWEAAHFAVQHQLDRVITIIDKNGLQGFGNTNDVLGDTASAEKMRALGFEVKETDGHDVNALIKTIEELKAYRNGKPKMIVAHTVKGKGVSWMENKMEWHYLPLNDELYAKAVKEISELYK
ncbi:MAG TPA: 1-deoxy-D-xylulose-5-phosphate synthase N-terminal domain-containing protein [Bacteroidia bacterium]|jgi:transketolase